MAIELNIRTTAVRLERGMRSMRDGVLNCSNECLFFCHEKTFCLLSYTDFSCDFFRSISCWKRLMVERVSWFAHFIQIGFDKFEFNSLRHFCMNIAFASNATIAFGIPFSRHHYGRRCAKWRKRKYTSNLIKSTYDQVICILFARQQPRANIVWMNQPIEMVAKGTNIIAVRPFISINSRCD